MSPKKKLEDVLEPDDKFGIMVGKESDIPSPQGRGRTSLVTQLTVAKRLTPVLAAIAENGIGISEEVFGVDFTAPGTLKEAQKLGLKKVAGSFFSWLNSQLTDYNLADKVIVTRREGGKKLFIRGPHPDEGTKRKKK